MAVNVLLHEDDSYILEKSSSERKSLLQISALKNTYAVQLSNGNSYIWVCFDFGCLKFKFIFLHRVPATRVLQLPNGKLSSQQSSISICLNATFSPPSSANSFSHMTIKRSQIMTMAHILRLFDLHPVKSHDSHWTNWQSWVWKIFIFLSQQLWHCLSKYKILFLKYSPRNSSDLLPN